MSVAGKACKLKHIRAVSVFGYAEADPSTQLYKDAFAVGKILAENCVDVINGGGPGVMKASTEGAHAGGGRARVATFQPKFVKNFEGKDLSNKADDEVVMSNYLERTLKLLEMGNAYVVMNGGTGTLSEFGMAWGLAYLYFGHHKPVILYGDFWYDVTETLVKNMLIGSTRPKALEVYKIATSPEMVVKYLEYFDSYLEEHSNELLHLEDGGTKETAFIN